MFLNKKCDFFLEVSNIFNRKELGKFYKIINKISSYDLKVGLTTLFKEIETITRHPCNAYMCQGNKCHSQKIGYPRYLNITIYGIFPYKCRSEKLVFCKDINFKEISSVTSMFKDYINSNSFSTFQLHNQRIFQEYVLTKFENLLPWNILLDIVEDNV